MKKEKKALFLFPNSSLGTHKLNLSKKKGKKGDRHLFLSAYLDSNK